MFTNLLLAVDVNDSDGAARSAAAAASMARAHGAVLHLLNVVPNTGMPIVGASLASDHIQQAVAAARSAMTEWAASHMPEDVSHEVHIAEGTVYDQIIRSANELGVDVIIVGSHRPELKDYLIGPNAARVARHADQSVFVVR